MKMDIDRIAALARIKLKAEEKEKLAADLGNILSYVEKLSSLDTENVPPTSHVLAIENVFRKDVQTPQRIIEEVLAKAPEREGDFFKVPKVVEGS
ncbi:MAG TPA: Asp-tRNA(Asn)/Glu-tRNA(Gln) amidotransferase subunit GatC [Candidatus Omnitrophota bacterium]|nr:Asp-tRNA(Asn)/Glu-tRNA(Gln) amidotransferase subunit GatC [Candidatus Omnitrophota bacterium]